MTLNRSQKILGTGFATGSAVLALDLGTITGWAISTLDRAGVYGHGTTSFKPGRYEGGGMRYLRFRKFLDDLSEEAGPFERIVFEEVRRHAGTDAAHVYGGFLATLTTWAEVREIPYEGVPIGTWKKALVGKGNASKGDVITAVKTKGLNPEDDNEADALGVLLWHLQENQ